MPRSGGTYSLPAGNPVVSGATISSTTHNATMTDIADALTASLAKDGQTVPTANLPMGGFRHTGVDDAGARTDYARADQVQDSTLTYLTSVAGTNTITATAPLSLAAYAAGQRFHFVAAGANTGAVTLNVNSIGAKAVTKHGTTALLAGDIQSGQVVTVTYDGTRFQVDHLQPASTGAACALLETETASASATLDFTLDLTNYSKHVIHFDNLKPVTDGAELWGRLSADGVTYATTAYRWARHNLTDAASEGLAGSTNDAKFLMANAVGNQDGEQVSGVVEITSVGGMGVRVSWRLNGENAAGAYYMINGMGAYVAAASTYFRLMFSTGNISSGTARMYGFKV